MNKSQHARPRGAVALWVIGSLVCTGLWSCSGGGCRSPEGEEEVSPAVRQAPAPTPRSPREEPLRFAVASMISAATTYDIYEEILRHVAEDAGRPFTFVQRRSYQEANELLVGGQVDLAFVCSGAFAMLPSDARVEILAVPVVQGSPTYHSLIITRADEEVTGLAGLEARRFAFTDPLSNTGYFYPLARLGELGETPSTFFANTTMTGSHDRSITAVYRKLVDAAAVDSLVYHQVVTPESRYAGKLKIIETSPGFPIPPFVSPTTVAPELRRSFRRSLLTLHETAEGRELLRRIGVDRFIEGDASSYGVIASYADRARKVLKQ